MKVFALLFTATILTFAGAKVAAQTEPYRRLVNFEWEPIEGATKYDIEIRQLKQDGKTFAFKVADAAWNGRLTPGGYEMKLRALDYRGVPGDWSEPSRFDVQLESARLISPAPKSIVKGNSGEETVEFKWAPVGGAKSYVVEVSDDDGAFKKSDVVTGTSWKTGLPVAKSYTWKVLGQASEEIKSEAISLAQFDVYGARVEKPSIEKPENEFVRDVKWNKPDNADSFDLAVSRVNPATKKWEKVYAASGVKDETLPFDPKWEGGTYRIDLRAKGDKRVSSEVASQQFKVRKGDRSPAAEFTHEVRKSIDRVNGWYGIASYLITMINYSSSDYDTPSGVGVSYSAVGGTGRLGAGYFKDDNPWGFLGILDMSGFINNENKNLTYSSMELSAVWRSASTAQDRGEIRVPMGLYYKEHQVAIGAFNTVTNTGSVTSYENAAVLGPHAGVEYWYSISPKLGFQANAHLYMSLIKMKTPNGGAIEPTMSTQLGILGSYRFSRRFTGLMGYAMREDQLKYKSTGGGTNEAVLKGNYLNFFAEYAF